MDNDNDTQDKPVDENEETEGTTPVVEGDGEETSAAPVEGAMPVEETEEDES